VLDAAGPTADPQAALGLARIALAASPSNEDLRRVTIELYRRAYGDRTRFGVVLAASGLTGGRPVRVALKLLDLCLTLQPGDPLISRMDDRVVQVEAIDVEHALFTLRREGRVTTLPAPEVAREYDRIAPDDFRALRQLNPARLTELLQNEPVTVVLGLLRAHGGHIDADLLKHELVPRFIEAKDWSRWWTRARTELKRSPHVTIEGRSPVILTYVAEARTLESETWETLSAQKDPVQWLATVEAYLRDKTERHETPDAALLTRFRDHLLTWINAVRGRRPAEALAGALVLERLADKGLSLEEAHHGLAATLLRESTDPTALLGELHDADLRERWLANLQQARPADWVRFAVAFLPDAPAPLLERLASSAIEAGETAAVQVFVDTALTDPPRHPEAIFWLWKGPKHAEALKLPPDGELFRLILDTLSALGRSVAAEHAVVKEFRARMKAALQLRSYDKVRKCLGQLGEGGAIVVRRQIQRMEGLGDNAPSRMLELLREVHPQLWIIRPTQVESWADPETVWSTAAGLARRLAERDDLVNVKMRDNARKIGEAASHGDLSENSEYKFALEERDLLRARLAAINDELSRARVLEPHDVPDDHVGVGSRVRLRNGDDGQERTVTFLGPFETDLERHIYSYQAPVAQQLMGKRIGDRVRLIFEGHESEFEVLALEAAVTRPTTADVAASTPPS
jgi:transcription elongation factor GreA